MEMKRVAMFLRKSQLEQLRKLSGATGAPVAELVRRAIDQYVKQQLQKRGGK
jgi:predicted DNA-binding protein